jgi:hypothetical protein
VYAERNTGTNYFGRLLVENTNLSFIPGGASPKVPWIIRKYEPVRDLICFLQLPFDLGWKHSFPPSKWFVRLAFADPEAFFFIAKDPYAWLLSLYEKPYNRRQETDDFSTFLRTPWKTLRRERAWQRQFENPIQLWNAKYAAYLHFHETYDLPSFLINYETILEDPDAFVRDVAQEMGATLTGDDVDNILKSPKVKDVKSFSYYQDYYLNQKYLDEMSDEDVAFISAELDTSLVEDWGYRIL